MSEKNAVKEAGVALSQIKKLLSGTLKPFAVLETALEDIWNLDNIASAAQLAADRAISLKIKSEGELSEVNFRLSKAKKEHEDMLAKADRELHESKAKAANKIRDLEISIKSLQADLDSMQQEVKDKEKWRDTQLADLDKVVEAHRVTCQKKKDEFDAEIRRTEQQLANAKKQLRDTLNTINIQIR